MMRVTIGVLALLIGLSATSADLCIVRGYVFTPDGAPVSDNTPLSITQHAYGVTYPIVTGVDWPYANFYLQAFRCNPQDVVEIRVDTLDYVYTRNITIIQNVNDINVTLSVKTSSSSDGGGGGGGSTIKIPATTGNATWIMEHQLIEIFTYDKWFDIERFVAEAYRITDRAITIVFREPQREIVIALHENQSLDLNGDGFEELTMRLDEVRDKRAYMTFIRNTEGAVVEKPSIPEKTTPMENASQHPLPESPMSGESTRAPVSTELLTKQNLLLMLIIIDLIIVLIIQLRRRKHYESR